MSPSTYFNLVLKSEITTKFYQISKLSSELVQLFSPKPFHKLYWERSVKMTTFICGYCSSWSGTTSSILLFSSFKEPYRYLIKYFEISILRF